MGTNPFTPSVGFGHPLTPLPRSGGTIASNAAGLFGGTQRIASCDSPKLVTFLQAHPDKAAAWAEVLGISPVEIASFVATLTPVVLRSDTAIINHGFVNGHATAFVAVLQAGTAVLVDRHGFPVTRCACGNPLTSPRALTRVTLAGPTWPNASIANITVIQPITLVLNSFTLVEPMTGAAFQRPAGTQGSRDSPATPRPGTPTVAPAPPVTPTPPPAASTSPTPPTIAVPPTTSGPAPPATSGPAPQAPPATKPVPPATSAGPLTATKPAPPTNTEPPPPPPTITKPAAPPPMVPPPATTSTPRNTASWVIGTCYVDRRTSPPTLIGTVLVRNNDTAAHSYRVTVAFGVAGPPVRVTVASQRVEPGRVVTLDVSVPGRSSGSEPTVACKIVRFVDEGRQTPR
jgi:hypothetical protein